jgi:hypothetical protein
MYSIAMRFTLTLFASILVCSCASVHIKGPLVIESDLVEEIEGVWVGGEKESILFIKNYGENKVKLAGLNWKRDGDKSRFEVDNLGDIVLSHDIFRSGSSALDGGLLFMTADGDSLVGRESEVFGDKIFFMKYFLSDNSIIIWMPDSDYFHDLVESGEIAGKVDSEAMDILLNIEASELISRLKDDSRSEQPSAFTTDNLVILRKVAPLPH